MTIQRFILCGLCVVLLGSRAAASDLTGSWAGLAPDGLVFPSASGLCNADLTLDLAENEGSLNGSVRVIAQVVTGGCSAQNLSSRELTTGQLLPSRLTGTAGVGTVSFDILMVTFLNGSPVSFSAIVASGTFTTERLTTTGTFIPSRAWIDNNHNNVPDCDLLKPAANGECGVLAQPTTSITLAANSGPRLLDGGTLPGNVTVLTGQAFICLSGTVTGNVTAQGGSLALSNCTVNGNVQVSGGGTLSVGSSTTIHGNLSVQNIPAGAGANQICGSKVDGNLQFHDNGTAVQIGSLGTACRGNTLGGNLDVHNNTAITTIDDNVVGGNLQDNNNTAATNIFNNTIAGNLQCQGNVAQPMNSITGGGNTAARKQGQCTGF